MDLRLPDHTRGRDLKQTNKNKLQMSKDQISGSTMESEILEFSYFYLDPSNTSRSNAGETYVGGKERRLKFSMKWNYLELKMHILCDSGIKEEACNTSKI